jgi:hypothetical protein
VKFPETNRDFGPWRLAARRVSGDFTKTDVHRFLSDYSRHPAAESMRWEYIQKFPAWVFSKDKWSSDDTVTALEKSIVRDIDGARKTLWHPRCSYVSA